MGKLLSWLWEALRSIGRGAGLARQSRPRTPQKTLTAPADQDRRTPGGQPDAASTSLNELQQAIANMSNRQNELMNVGPLDFAGVVARLDEIIERQFADARTKLQNSSYWGPVGMLVQIAAVCCKRAVKQNVDRERKEANLDSMVLCLWLGRSAYKGTYPDEDGYGAATYGEVIRDIINLQKGLGRQSLHSLESLQEVDVDAFETLAAYYALSIEVGDLVDDYTMGDYEGCYAIATKIADHSTVDKNRRFAKRLLIVLLQAQGHIEDGRKLRLGSEEGSFESLLDRLAAGEQSIESALADNLPPFQCARVHYWGGEALRARGDALWQSHLQRCVEFNFDFIECVLARSVLGLSWKPEITQFHDARSITPLPR